EQVPQAAPACLALQVLQDRWWVPPAGGGLLGEDRLGGVDVAVHERQELLAQVLGLRVVRELHGRPLSRSYGAGGQAPPARVRPAEAPSPRSGRTRRRRSCRAGSGSGCLPGSRRA